jgi:hypothetical protein
LVEISKSLRDKDEWHQDIKEMMTNMAKSLDGSYPAFDFICLGHRYYTYPNNPGQIRTREVILNFIRYA